MTDKNVLFILSDEHSRAVLGCYGNSAVSTPHLDALAARGTRFATAYCNSPICIPSRASLATGRYNHEIGYWDNAEPYDGAVPGWANHLSEAGHRVTSIGKLHFRDEQAPVGFESQILPMHVVEGKGDLHGLLRSPPRPRPGMRRLAEELGPGWSSYAQYDSDIADAACSWLGERAAAPDDKTWVGFVSFVCPHFPLVAPQAFFELYDPARLPWPKGRGETSIYDHPVLAAFRRYQNYDDYFRDEAQVRLAITSYYALVSYLDHNVGRVLQALQDSGLADDTLVIYSSDHGDNLGTRGFWGKSLLFEESAGVPMILAGPGVPAGKVSATPVTLVDVAPTLYAAADHAVLAREAAGLPGRSLLELAAAPDDTQRCAFAEYHAVGAVTGCFMLRCGRWKYLHYEGYPGQLFDLESDPDELVDRAGDPSCAAVLGDMEGRLKKIVDPAEATARAFADQRRVIEANGGEEGVLRRGEFPHTPAPGEAPSFFDAATGN